MLRTSSTTFSASFICTVQILSAHFTATATNSLWRASSFPQVFTVWLTAMTRVPATSLRIIPNTHKHTLRYTCSTCFLSQTLFVRQITPACILIMRLAETPSPVMHHQTVCVERQMRAAQKCTSQVNSIRFFLCLSTHAIKLSKLPISLMFVWAKLWIGPLCKSPWRVFRSTCVCCDVFYICSSNPSDTDPAQPRGRLTSFYSIVFWSYRCYKHHREHSQPLIW